MPGPHLHDESPAWLSAGQAAENWHQDAVRVALCLPMPAPHLHDESPVWLSAGQAAENWQ
eukprot:1158199-Pelagomonas_calceolata.AAC.2